LIPRPHRFKDQTAGQRPGVLFGAPGTGIDLKVEEHLWPPRFNLIAHLFYEKYQGT